MPTVQHGTRTRTFQTATTTTSSSSSSSAAASSSKVNLCNRSGCVQKQSKAVSSFSGISTSSTSLCSSSSSSSTPSESAAPLLPVFVAPQVPFLDGLQSLSARNPQKKVAEEASNFKLKCEKRIMDRQSGYTSDKETHPATIRRLQRSVSSVRESFGKEQREYQEEGKLGRKKMKQNPVALTFNGGCERFSVRKEEEDHLLKDSAELQTFEPLPNIRGAGLKAKRMYRVAEGPSLEAAVINALSISDKPQRAPLAKQEVPKRLLISSQQNSVHLPSTIILKRSLSASCYKGDAFVFKDFVKGEGSPPSTYSATQPVHETPKSPSSMRWEEAAKYEERKEQERRQRGVIQSQPRRCNRVPRLFHNGSEEEGEEDNEGEEEWAVYSRSGFVSLRPKERNDEVGQLKMGRCRSMRETCGTNIEAANQCVACGRSLCARCSGSGPASAARPVKRGFLGACKRLLGLSKKCRPCQCFPQCHHFFPECHHFQEHNERIQRH